MAARAYQALFALALPALAVSVTGCVEDIQTADLDPEAYTERVACDDLTVIAATSDGSEALLLGIDDGLKAAVLDYGEPVSATYVLPDERLTVRWAVGSNVYLGQCGLDSGAPWRVDTVHDAIDGEIEVYLVPNPDGTVQLSAELEGLLLEDAETDGPLLALESTHIEAQGL